MAKDPKLDLLRNVPLFRDCSGRVQQQVAQLADEIDVPAGKVLIREGRSAEEFFVIISGSVRVERDGRLMRTLGPGDFFGEIALVTGGPRTASAITEEPCRLLVVEHRAFNSLLATSPGIQLEILKALGERVRDLMPDAH